MNSVPRSSFASSLLRVNLLAALLLGVAPVAVYWNALHTPFVLDDGPSITDNASIRSLWPLSGPLSPPAGGLPVSARPVANLSFALNYAIGGESVGSYHAVNVLLHLLTGLVLFGVLRRTLANRAVPEKFRGQADWLALAIAALWALHPLNTAVVTYVSQRTELLAAFFYVGTLWAFIRALESAGRANPPDEPGLMPPSDVRLIRRIRPTSIVWAVIAVIACLLGMGSKEIMASAPLIVLLYDRTFFAGTFAEAWRRRGRLHAALMATWLLLIWLVWHSGSRGGTAGFGMGVSPLAYLVTQGQAIMGYLARSVYPYPLVFDYGDYLVPMSYSAWLDVALVGGLFVAAVTAVRGKPLIGFSGVLFFAVLAPTSSVVPVATQTIADHRMYLPLAVVLTSLVLAAYHFLERRAWIAGVVAAVGFGGLTIARNTAYASPVTLWRDTVQKRPDNIRARNNLAAALLESHQTEAGLAELRTALELKPDHADALRNLAQAELDANQVQSALAHVERAQQLDPSRAAGWSLLGAARLRAGNAAWAVEAYAQARQLRPDSLGAMLGEAIALYQAERDTEALALFEQVHSRNPNYPSLRLNYGGALLDTGKPQPALAEFDAALARETPSVELLHLRSVALLQLGRKAEAVEAVRATLKLAPSYQPAVELARELGL